MERILALALVIMLGFVCVNGTGHLACLMSLAGDTDRVYTDAEIAYCAGNDQHLAGRFAAKEAVSKALGCGIGEISWQEIEILNDDLGAPVLHLHGKAAERAEQMGLSEWSVSITNLKEYAAASVVACSGNL